MSRELFESAMHLVAHGIHAYRHQKHAAHNAARARAYEMSRLAGTAFDACEQLGWTIKTLKPSVATLWCGDAPCAFSVEDGEVQATSFVYRFRVKRATDAVTQFLERQNRSTELGEWQLILLDDGYRIGLIVPIPPDAVDAGTFASVAAYVHREIVAMEERLATL